MTDHKKSEAKKGKSKKYIITSAQACYYVNKDGDKLPWGGGIGKAKPHTSFLRGLETYAKDIGAELIIQPIAGKQARENILHESLEGRPDIFHGKRLVLNSNLEVRNIVVPPQNVDPTTGKKSLVSKYNTCLIFPHSKQRYLPVAVKDADLPRYIYTTGAMTLPNYNVANHRGDTAERNHVFGALIVEVVDNKSYNIRNIRALKNGKFVDLGTVYNGAKVQVNIAANSLVLGDIHWGDHEPKTIKANYEMIDFFKPKNIFLHDFFNGGSINHHEKDNKLMRYREYARGRLSLDEELRLCYEELARMAKYAGKKTTIYIVSSNHQYFLARYINSDAWMRHELWNTEVATDLFSKGIALKIPESEIDDSTFLFEEGLKRHGKIPCNVVFLRLNDNVRNYGYQLANHGHKGGHGARGGGARAREITGGGKSITAHSHCMELYGETYIVGTSTKLNLPYTMGGGSAWIAANAVLYENGTVQMIPIINGHWRLQGKYL